jgi:hypothetical protein
MEVDAVVGWVKSLAAQLLAKRALEQYCSKLPMEEEISISIITTDRSKLRYPSWSTMGKVIEEVMESSEATGMTSDALLPDAIGLLKDRILTSKIQNKVVVNFKTLLASPDLEGNDSFPSGLHCEFILAAYLLYPELANPTHDENLLSITKVLLSCPCFPPLDN